MTTNSIGFKWVHVDKEGRPSEANTFFNDLTDLNPQGRTSFQTEEQANQALTAWLEKHPSESKDNLLLLKIF